MTEHVWRHSLSLQRWAVPFGAALVAGDQSLDGIPAQRPAATAREGRRSRLGGALAEPLRQELGRFPAEWRASLLPALPLAAYVGPGAQDDVGASQADEFGYPQPRLDPHQQQRPVPAADPGRPVRRGQ